MFSMQDNLLFSVIPFDSVCTGTLTHAATHTLTNITPIDYHYQTINMDLWMKPVSFILFFSDRALFMLWLVQQADSITSVNKFKYFQYIVYVCYLSWIYLIVCHQQKLAQVRAAAYRNTRNTVVQDNMKMNGFRVVKTLFCTNDVQSCIAFAASGVQLDTSHAHLDKTLSGSATINNLEQLQIESGKTLITELSYR